MDRSFMNDVVTGFFPDPIVFAAAFLPYCRQNLKKIPTREMARCRIKGNLSQPLLLTVPVQGGASILKKNIEPEKILLSDHGNWRHNHLKAFEAAYGKSPFYQHLIPVIEDIYARDFSLLSEFNNTIQRELITFLLGNTDPNISTAIETLDESVIKRGKELVSGLDLGLSVLDAIMRNGPETLLALLVLNRK